MLKLHELPTMSPKGELWQHVHQNAPLLVRTVNVPASTLLRVEYSAYTGAPWKDWVTAGQFEGWIHEGLWYRVVDPDAISRETRTQTKLVIIHLPRRQQAV